MKNPIKIPRIIIYDDESMQYITGYSGNVCVEVNSDKYYNLNEPFPSHIIKNRIFTCAIDDAKLLDNIKLDPTTMERIAKFNKEQEIRRLDEEINKKKEKIKELDDILQDKDKRVQKLKEFVANIYNIDVNDDDDEEDYDDFYY